MPLYLADTSAWHRSGRVAERWSALLDSGELALTEAIALEILYSAPAAPPTGGWLASLPAFGCFA